MKKSLLALAVLGAFAGTASAQSSVTIGGTLDVNARSVKNDGAGTRQSLSTNGLSSSALRFFGTEDMGGGFKAGFWLEAATFPDTGTVDTTRFFGRRATVSLIGRMGEVRLGRDYTPTFWNMTVFDPYGTNGVGNSLNISSNTQPTQVRADNSIGYFLPAMGGIYGQAMVAAGEGVDSGKYQGARLGFASGPFNVAAAAGRQYLVGGVGRYNTWNIGGSYNFGIATLMGYYNNEKNTLTNVEENRLIIGGSVPLGQGTITAAYGRTDVKNSDNDATQLVAGYQHSLSKRTTLYGTVSRLDNKGLSAKSIPGGAPGITAGGKSTGMEFGIRHTF
jgi:predicted porin